MTERQGGGAARASQRHGLSVSVDCDMNAPGHVELLIEEASRKAIWANPAEASRLLYAAGRGGAMCLQRYARPGLRIMSTASRALAMSIRIPHDAAAAPRSREVCLASRLRCHKCGRDHDNTKNLSKIHCARKRR